LGPDDRIHCKLNQTGTRTGRLSASNPNLQNIPIRNDEFHIRSMFVCPPGMKMLGCDYPQIQPRLAAVFANEEKMLEAIRNGFDLHSANAANMYGPKDERIKYEAIDKAKTCKEMREKLGRPLSDIEKLLLKKRDGAKTVGLGVLFGEGKTKMAHQLGIEVHEAAELIDTFFTTYPNLKKLIDDTHTECHELEFAYTMLGRIRRLHMINNPHNYGKVAGEERAGFNHKIQGSEMEVMKLAMLQIDASPDWNALGGELALTVHDELLSFAPEDCAEDALEVKSALMADPLRWGPIRLRLPVSVKPDGGIGRSWTDVH
jgi:DNA polymerase I